MHVLFVHQNYPAQFGHVARYLADRLGWRATFVSEKPPATGGRVERVQYAVRGGATQTTHFCGRTFENGVWHTHAVYEALKARPDVKPDLVVGHSGFGSTLFLRELYGDTPIVNYFEYLYRPTGSDVDFRPDFPSDEMTRLRCRSRNAMILLDLNNCDRGYSPTDFQRSLMPTEYQGKLSTIFDGIDTTVWRPRPGLPRQVGNLTIPDGVKVVTYATRGMEAMRGFDVFMRAAKTLCDRRRDVLFVVAGNDRVAYGGDLKHTGGASFKEWVLSRDEYDLSRFVFTGLLPPEELAKLFALTDAHVYLTVPFVLSWSLLNALACGAPVVASDTAPVREVIRDGVTGRLVDFFDADGFAAAVGAMLDDPAAARRLGAAGVELVRDRYAVDVCLPQMVRLYKGVTARATPSA